MKHLPNILTLARIVLALFVFGALICAADWIGIRQWLSHEAVGWLLRLAFAAYVIAAVTDFLDGWLARRLDATSVWGAILDPIADKMLVCAVIVGLCGIATVIWFTIPAGVILLREFSVSALREVVAKKGVSLPVTLLAKWKTTFQLVALGLWLIVVAWPSFGLTHFPSLFPSVLIAAATLLWLAAAITVVTGLQYLLQARRALAEA